MVHRLKAIGLFFGRFDLATLKTSELFRSGKDKYESFVAFNKPVGGMTGNVPITEFIVRRESPTEPPNLYLRSQSENDDQMVSEKTVNGFQRPFTPTPRNHKQLVKYKRDDGVDLSFTLYLPPGYKKGTRLPTVVWAYPLEFTDNSTASQVSGSTNRFTQISGYLASVLFA